MFRLFLIFIIYSILHYCSYRLESIHKLYIYKEYRFLKLVVFFIMPRCFTGSSHSFHQQQKRVCISHWLIWLLLKHANLKVKSGLFFVAVFLRSVVENFSVKGLYNFALPFDSCRRIKNLGSKIVSVWIYSILFIRQLTQGKLFNLCAS